MGYSRRSKFNQPTFIFRIGRIDTVIANHSFELPSKKEGRHVWNVVEPNLCDCLARGLVGYKSTPLDGTIKQLCNDYQSFL